MKLETYSKISRLKRFILSLQTTMKNHTNIEESVEKKYVRKDKEKERKRKKVSGKGVFGLKKIITDK